MEMMDLLLLLPIAIFAVINVVASTAVVRFAGMPRSQRTRHLVFIWLVPILGAAVCLSSVSWRTHGLFAVSPSFSSTDPAVSGGHGDASLGDSGGAGCGDSSGGDGGAGGC